MYPYWSEHHRVNQANQELKTDPDISSCVQVLDMDSTSNSEEEK